MAGRQDRRMHGSVRRVNGLTKCEVGLQTGRNTSLQPQAELLNRAATYRGKAIAKEVLSILVGLLEPKDGGVLTSPLETRGDVIRLRSLDVPNTLYRNSLSTNSFENSFRDMRKMWRGSERNQPGRGLAGICGDRGRETFP